MPAHPGRDTASSGVASGWVTVTNAIKARATMTIRPTKSHAIDLLIRRAFGIVALVAVLSLAAVASAYADVSKFFNASHSLTGGCATTGIDPIADPDCPSGPHPPEGSFAQPTGVATDGYGDIYVISRRGSVAEQGDYHVNIFDPGGHYIGQVSRPGMRLIAVDSTGHLYVYSDTTGSSGVFRYDPTVYNPAAGEIVYGSAPVTISEDSAIYGSLVVDPTNDHFYLAPGSPSASVHEYAPPVDGVPNALLTDEIAKGLPFMGQMALDAAHHRIYLGEADDPSKVGRVAVFDSRPPYTRLMTIDGSQTPAKTFQAGPKLLPAVDEATGHLFVADGLGVRSIREFDEAGNYVGTLAKPPTPEVDFASMAIDNSEDSPNRGYLYVPSGLGSAGNLLAYEPKVVPEAPKVESVTFDGLTEEEAVLKATINPKGASTHWALEYVTQQHFEEEGFSGALLAGEGEVAVGNEGVKVSGPATGLSAGASYRFRAKAENQCSPAGCVGEKEGTFTTFIAPSQSGGCANQALRGGASAALPDCRAYELVTPVNTGGLLPKGPDSGSTGPKWPTPPASPDGESVAFMIFGGLIPGFDATGGPTEIGDTYVSGRTAAGWRTQAKSPNGTQAVIAHTGGLSSDHGYLAMEVAFQGTLLVNEEQAEYVRYPDGTFHLPGEGSIATAPWVRPLYIAPHGSHTLISSRVPGAPSGFVALQLEPNAPPDGTEAIYDRTSDQVLHVVSLLPGDVTPAAGQGANYVGSSADGSAVAFGIGGDPTPIYLRLDNTETLIAAPAGARFAGLSSDGHYLFYVSAGDLYRFDSESQVTDRLTETGNVTPVNISSSGAAAYFLSPSALPTGPNPNLAEPQPGGRNLYRWEGGTTGFLATVTARDADGEDDGTGAIVNGLGLWLTAVGQGSPAILSSRASADGSVFLFESRADLSSPKSGGRAEIYRYDSVAGSLQCISCDPTGAAPVGDATLVPRVGTRAGVDRGLDRTTVIPNLSADGSRSFFETPQRLVSADNDGLVDVYEWEAQGKGSCTQPDGCLFLVSSGQSARDNHIFGISESGDDVFILTADLLAPEDVDETPSVYDARVGGGFPSQAESAGECLGEACQPAVRAPSDPTPNSSSYSGQGNVVAKAPLSRCAAGNRKVRKASKSRCNARKKKRHNRPANAKRRAHR